MSAATFGPVSPAVRERLEALSPQELRQALVEFANGPALNGLHLDN